MVALPRSKPQEISAQDSCLQQALAQDPLNVDVDKPVVKLVVTLDARAAAGAGCPLPAPPRRSVARDHIIGSSCRLESHPPVESYRPSASFAELGLYCSMFASIIL